MKHEFPPEIEHAIATEKELIEQTIKWLDKIKSIRVTSETEKGKWLIRNIEAYISDAGDFLKKKDYVRSFEAVLWSWALYETGVELGELKK